MKRLISRFRRQNILINQSKRSEVWLKGLRFGLLCRFFHRIQRSVNSPRNCPIDRTPRSRQQKLSSFLTWSQANDPVGLYPGHQPECPCHGESDFPKRTRLKYRFRHKYRLDRTCYSILESVRPPKMAIAHHQSNKSPSLLLVLKRT